MFRIEVCSEEKTQVYVSLSEFVEEYKDSYVYDCYFDKCIDLIYHFEYKEGCEIENPDDSLYFVLCDSKELAEDVEEWLDSKFDDLETEINDELDALMEEYEE